MENEELRARLAGVCGSAASVRVPPVEAIRRRMRRRQARQATAGVLTCASVTVAVVLIHGAVGTPGTGRPANNGSQTVPACASKHISISWVRSFPVDRLSVEAPPKTYLLGFRNNGRVGCTLTGWPQLDVTVTHPQRRVWLSYGTLNTLLSRVIEPTRVLVRPGATAVSAVTIYLAPGGLECGNTAWKVTPPGPASAASVIPGGPRYVCFGTSVDVSPIYPASVQISQNYPRSVPKPSPVTTTNPQPRANAGPAAAPYFVTIDAAKAPAPAEVRSWRTGRVTAIIEPPAGSGGFTGVAGAENDATFVLAAGTTHSRFYQVRLWHGTPTPLVPLHVPSIAGPDAPFAVSADGSKLAVAMPGAHGTAKILVVDLVSGPRTTWQSPIRGTVTRLSWAGNVRLMLLWNTTVGGVSAADRSGLRVLTTRKLLHGDMLRSRLLIPATVRFGALHGIADPLANPAGRVVFATMTSRSGGSARAAVVAFSGTTGRPLRLVTPSTDESGFGAWCGALWSNPAGTDVLATCRTQGEWRIGRFTPVQLHFPAPGFSGGGPDFFGW